MARPGLQGIDESVEKTYGWLNEIADLLERPGDLHTAYRALRSVLHTIRDLTTVDEAAQFSAQLPMVVRGLYFEGWNPASNGPRDRTAASFLERVGDEHNLGAHIDPERAAKAVGAVLRKRVSGGEIKDVLNTLPKQVRGVLGTEAAHGGVRQ